MRLPICLVLICCTLQSFADGRKVDSLFHELQLAKTPAKQSAIYVQLGLAVRSIDPDKTVAYCRKAIQIASKAKAYNELTKAYATMSFGYEASGQIDNAMYVADTALYYSAKSTDVRANFDAEHIKAVVLKRKARFDEALEHYMKAVEIAEKAGDQAYIGKAYQAIGSLYVTTKDLDRANEYHLKALDIRLKVGDLSEIWRSYDCLGIVQRDSMNYEKALAYYKKGEPYALQTGDSSIISFLYNDLGAIYSMMEQFAISDKYLRASIGIRERHNEYNELAYTYNYLGDNYDRQDSVKEAEPWYKKALATARRNGNSKQTYEAFQSISNYYARNNIFDSAYRYASLQKQFKDSVVKADQVATIALMNARFETEKKERLIKEQEFAISKRNYWLAGVSGLLLMGTSIGYSGYRRYRFKQQVALQRAVLRQQELATKAIIEAEEGERKRIAGDLHDGLGQMMSAAKLNLSTLQHDLHFREPAQQLAYEKVLAMVDECCREVRAVSHNIMPNALLKASLSSAIREFVDKIDSRVIQVNLYSEGLNERLDANIETVLYRVVQECVNNVIKHSGADKLDITLIRDEEGISITIEDNGKGFAANEQYEGMGLKNMRTRIDYLKGTIEWDSAIGRGTAVMIHVKA